MTQPVPFKSSLMTVKPEWTDYNGHMNMAYYSVLFDLAADEVYPLIGFGPDYRSARGHTTYTAEFHISYIRELHEGSKVWSTFQLVDHNDRSFHTYQELYHEDGWLAATGEALGLHIDMSGPRVAPFPADVAGRIADMHAAHSALGRPARAGRSISIRHRKA